MTQNKAFSLIFFGIFIDISPLRAMQTINTFLTTQKSIGHDMVDPSSIIQTLTGLVIFEISNKELCIDIKDVTAIINPNEIEDYQNKFDENKDILQLNGSFLQLIKVGQYLDSEAMTITKDSRIVLMDNENGKYGFIVDKITEIITVDTEFRYEMLKFIPSEKNPYLFGSIKYEGRDLYYPNFSKMILDFKS